MPTDMHAEPGFLPPSDTPPSAARMVLGESGVLRAGHAGTDDLITPWLAQWYTVRVGLRLAAISMFMLAIGGCALPLPIVFRPFGDEKLFAVIGGFTAGVACIVGAVILLVSMGFMLAAPRVKGMHDLGRAAFGLMLAPLAALLVLVLLSTLNRRMADEPVIWVNMIEALVGGGLICFVILLRRIAGVFACRRWTETAMVVSMLLVLLGAVGSWTWLYLYERLPWQGRDDVLQPVASVASVLAAGGFALLSCVCFAVTARLRDALPTMVRFGSVAHSEAPTRKIPADWEELRLPHGPLTVTIWRKPVDGGWLVSGQPWIVQGRVFVNDPDRAWDGTTEPDWTPAAH
ncbi:MAG: hypothetical protein AB7K09_00960 [Planctomycetota bacterium]